MAISRKPKEENPPTVDVDALILRGGSVASAEVKIGSKGKDSTPVVLRIPTTLLERIDDALQARSVKIPRHTWLLEAVVEKLNREAG